MRYIRTIILLMGIFCAVSMRAQTAAGTTADRATHVKDTVLLSVQSGGNFIRLEMKNLPATITYMPDASFGPEPVLLLLGDTFPSQNTFADCKMTWKWELEKSVVEESEEEEQATIIELKAHEDALILVEPLVCPENSDTVAEVWDSIAWYGKIYKESGEYPIIKTNEKGCEWIHTLHLTVHKTVYSTISEKGCDSLEFEEIVYMESVSLRDTVALENGDREIRDINITIAHPSFGEITEECCGSFIAPSGRVFYLSGDYTDTIRNAEGCDSIIELHLDITPDCTVYDTIYFCAGQNTNHEEKVTDAYVRRYFEYLYQTPQKEWYMDGVIMQSEATRSLINFNRAESNLRAHYIAPLTPVKSIIWTYRSATEAQDHVIEPSAAPQWIAAGRITMTVRFVCGQVFVSDMETDIENAQEACVPVKIIENGQVVILRGGVKFNVLGNKLQ